MRRPETGDGAIHVDHHHQRTEGSDVGNDPRPQTEDELATMRATVMRKALDGDVEGAADLAAVHDLIKGDAPKSG